ncbi:MAG: hypothetical protein ACRDRM_04750 [Pseudonocardiaceae bacterium]
MADAARTALRRAGYPASVITTDDAAGYPQGAPYDRLVSTAAVRWQVPRAWVKQTRPGGLSDTLSDRRGVLRGSPLSLVT